MSTRGTRAICTGMAAGYNLVQDSIFGAPDSSNLLSQLLRKFCLSLKQPITTKETTSRKPVRPNRGHDRFRAHYCNHPQCARAYQFRCNKRSSAARAASLRALELALTGQHLVELLAECDTATPAGAAKHAAMLVHNAARTPLCILHQICWADRNRILRL